MHVPLSCFMLKLAFPVAGQGGREGTNGMETLKAIGRKWNDISLIKRILVGLVIGAVLGVFFGRVTTCSRCSARCSSPR